MSDRFLILVDPAYDHGRGRGILCRDTAGIGPNDVNVMIMRACGLEAVAVPLEPAFALDLSPMPGAVQRIGRPMTYANVESIACRETGISTEERALTLRTLGAWDAAPADFILFGEESGTGDQPRLVASPAG